MFRVRADVFSEMKTKHAPRLLELDEPLFDSLVSFGLEESMPSAEYYFLSDDGTDWSVLREIDEALVSAAVQVTGEAAFRKYSFRAAAVCARTWHDWEDVASGLIHGTWTPADCRDWLDRESKRPASVLVKNSRETGHGHTLVTVVYYIPIWPFQLAAQLRATLADLTPGTALFNRSLGSTQSFRQAKSRGVKVGRAICPWDFIAQHDLRRLHLMPLAADEPSAVVAPRAIPADGARPAIAAAVKFSACVILGGNRDKYAHDNGIATPFAMRIRASHPADTSSLIARRRGEPSQEALAEDRAFLDSELGARLLAALLSAEVEAACGLGDDLSTLRAGARLPQLRADALVAKLNAHLSCLPCAAGVQIRFSANHEPPLKPEQINAFGGRLVVGSPNGRIGMQPQYQVIDLSRPRDTELTGRLTVVARVLITSIRCVRTVWEDLS